MDIYIIRHGLAADISPTGKDADRPLTPKGKRRFANCVKGLEALDIRLDLVLHSPWLRAKETAQLLKPICEGRIESTDLLAAPPGTALLDYAAEQASGSDSIALVGHQPWLGELCSLLMTGDNLAAHNIEVNKGSVMLLTGSPKPGRAALKLVLSPEVLVKLAGASDE
jgi:phosphohistidine phosphatase